MALQAGCNFLFFDEKMMKMMLKLKEVDVRWKSHSSGRFCSSRYEHVLCLFVVVVVDFLKAALGFKKETVEPVEA